MNAFTFSKTLSVTGEISADEDLLIDGTVNGSIRVPGHAIVIGPTAEIKADVHARLVEIHGRVDATIIASERAIIRATAHVAGRVVSPRLVVEEGATIHGQLDSRNTDAAVSVARYRADRA
ncbi:MAG: polymer-forming cytoskeletal protein [Acidobacteriota bacterium]|nr:polymer-forming cytoskeletal protein [Acidobacteriota bacterium]